MAKITAKSKYGKRFNISVEDKHGYYNFPEQTIAITSDDQQGYPGDINNNGNCIGADNISLYDITRQITISQGSNESQRIGNKVYMKFLHFTYAINLIGNTIITHLNYGTNADMFMRFRVMVVKFDDSMTITRNEVVNWFRATYIYFKMKTLTNGSMVPIQSIHQTKLRESTEYTGKFKILYDKKLKFGKKKTVKIANISIPIKQNLTFENTNNQCTDGSFKNIFAIIIGPGCNQLDLDAVGADKVYYWHTSRNIANTKAVLKWEYYDM